MMKDDDDSSRNMPIHRRRRADDQDHSTLENESAIIWSDNPEQAYFQAMMIKKQGNDSLIGDSTVAGMINDTDTLPTYDPQHVVGAFGAGSSNPYNTAATSQGGDTLDRILRQSPEPVPERKRSRTRSWFSKQRFSPAKRPSKALAESNNEVEQIEIIDESMFDLEQDELPSVIFVNGQPSAITTSGASSPSKKSYAAVNGQPPEGAPSTSYPSRRRRGTWAQWTIVVLLVLVIAAVVMLVLTFTDNQRDDKSIAQAASGRDAGGDGLPPSASTQVEDSGEPVITNTPAVAPTMMPILLTRQPVVLSGQTKEPSISTLSPTDIATTSPSVPPTGGPTHDPSVSPTPSPTTSAPTAFPTRMPTLSPSAVTPPPVPILDDFLNRLVALSPKSASALSTPSSPQYRALEWISTEPDAGSFSDETLAERWALTSFYMGAEGYLWLNKRRRLNAWLSTGDVCTWFGITCDVAGNVKEISLVENNLKGTLPFEFFLLSELSVLRLDNNAMTGTIPSDLAMLTNLNRLQLSSNSFGGTLPTELGLLSSLNFLSFARNDNISGTIPSEIGLLSNIGTLDFAKNKLSGSVPSEIGNLTLLKLLTLRANQLTGELPSELSQLSSLEKLSIAVTSLDGRVPDPVCALEGIGVSADCQEIDCPCCSRCCIDGMGCFDATASPAGSGSELPSVSPTLSPVIAASTAPSAEASAHPSTTPSSQPSAITAMPSSRPTQMPVPFPTTLNPTESPSDSPSNGPSSAPTTLAPTKVPSHTPTISPSSEPTLISTGLPSNVPTSAPTIVPSVAPTPTPTEDAVVDTPTAPCVDRITASKSCYNLGERIVLEFTNCNPLSDDWIGIYDPPVNENDLGSTGAWVWACGSRTCSTAVDSGSVTFSFAQTGGTFQAFLVRRNSGGPYSAYAATEEFVVDATGLLCPNGDTTEVPTAAPAGSIVVSNTNVEEENTTTPFT